MKLATTWLDESDEDELDTEQAEGDASASDAPTEEAGPFDHSELVDDEIDALDAALEPDEVPDEDGFDVVTQYFQESARHQLLSVAQEQALTQAVARGHTAAKKLARTRPTLNSATRQQLRRDLAQAQAARDELVRSNARLVISIAKRYQDLGLPLMDLIQEGNLGLLRAIDRFEPARGLRLSTYATWWVRQGINRAVANQGRTIRLPAYLQDRLHQLYQVSQTLEQSLGRAPTDAEIARQLAIPPADLRLLQTLTTPVISLDDPLNADDDDSALEQMEDTQITPVDELVARRLLRTSLERAVAELPARLALIVRMRYGLGDNRPHTLESIARKLSLSRERVRQIERDAFARLRTSAEVRRQWLPLGM
jgi:RNA polymerase primary sigma factor